VKQIGRLGEIGLGCGRDGLPVVHSLADVGLDLLQGRVSDGGHVGVDHLGGLLVQAEVLGGGDQVVGAVVRLLVQWLLLHRRNNVSASAVSREGIMSPLGTVSHDISMEREWGSCLLFS